MKKACALRIRGRVQGVGYRYYAMSKAAEYGISGYVTNMPDGSVYIEVEGDEENLNAFIESCRKGPVLSKVIQFDAFSQPVSNYTGFEIR